ncbi:MAG: phenylalanine 4-monooxygenase [Steroidobacteraceae bacterium]
MQPPQAPTQSNLSLRGDYTQAAPDYTVRQVWEQYSDDEHDIWNSLFRRQIELAQRFATPEFLDGLEQLGAHSELIPRFAEVNRTLQRCAGWQIVAVPGLIPEEQFFGHLARRSFPVSVWIRARSELEYLSEPDLFHDFFGHVPLLTNPVFAAFMQAYGAAGPRAASLGALQMLARLYWYTVEFGLIDTPLGLKCYGAGILSSQGETVYSVESPEPHRIWYELTRVLRTNYLIDAYQRSYFVLESIEQLLRSAYDTDFAPLYQAFAGTPGIAAGIVLAEDRLYS